MKKCLCCQKETEENMLINGLCWDCDERTENVKLDIDKQQDAQDLLFKYWKCVPIEFQGMQLDLAKACSKTAIEFMIENGELVGTSYEKRQEISYWEDVSEKISEITESQYEKLIIPS